MAGRRGCRCRRRAGDGRRARACAGAHGTGLCRGRYSQPEPVVPSPPFSLPPPRAWRRGVTATAGPTACGRGPSPLRRRAVAEAQSLARSPPTRGFDLSHFGPTLQAAYKGPTEDNPSLSLKYRLRKAAGMDQMAKREAEAELSPRRSRPGRGAGHHARRRATRPRATSCSPSPARSRPRTRPRPTKPWLTDKRRRPNPGRRRCLAPTQSLRLLCGRLGRSGCSNGITSIPPPCWGET